MKNDYLEEKNKLKNIFGFLIENRKYNKELQEKFYSSVLNSYDNKYDKLISLLYHIANTQSQPNIDKLAAFFINLNENKKCLESFESFINYLKNCTKKEIDYNFKGLFVGMNEQSGWGQKTSALFVKTIFHLHNNQYSKELKIWDDVPNRINERDEFFLPVDAVIIAIFHKLNSNRIWSFYKINKLLKEEYSNEQIEVWDDLWFWGFISQHGSSLDRKFEWNLNKYWVIKESNKNQKFIGVIKEKVKLFISIF